jgi:hypothetical protein
MNFQEKVFKATADLRSRAAAIAQVAVAQARERAETAGKRVQGLKGSLPALTVAGREFNKVARRHAVRFLKENSSIAVEAGKDVSALVRTTYATLSQRATVKPKARKASVKRKRASVRKAA